MNGLASVASLASPAVFIVAGYLAGRLLPVAPRRLSGGASPAGQVVGALIALPLVVLTALILLAKLFDSAVLGWMFGLGLVLCVLLVPCAAFATLGWVLGRRGARRRAADTTATAAAPSTSTPALPVASEAALVVRLVRDDVHASDTEGLDSSLEVVATTSLSALLGRIAASGFLPGIRGGHATWVVESPAPSAAASHSAIGVIAEQWAQPVLNVADQCVSAHFAGVAPWLRLRYRDQSDPADVLAELRSATPAG